MGQGTYGYVHSGEQKGTGEQVAIKAATISELARSALRKEVFPLIPEFWCWLEGVRIGDKK